MMLCAANAKFIISVCVCVHCSSIMSQMDLIASITEENKRRNMKRTVLTTMYIESVCLALAYLSMQRAAKNLGCFGDEEHPYDLRKYLLKEIYNGSEVTCYDELRLTKRNFHDLRSMLREKCGLVDNIYVIVEKRLQCFYWWLDMVLR
ncbi:hypothetical protein VPH35_104150 [Triticum aestivum]